MKTHSLRGALKQEVRRAVAREGKAISKRLERTRARLRALRAVVRRQAAELARAQRRLTRLSLKRGAPTRSARPAAGPGMTPGQIRAARGGRSRRAFAEILGVSANSIFLWETGRVRPRGTNLARLERTRGPKRGPGRPRGSGAGAKKRTATAGRAKRVTRRRRQTASAGRKRR